MTAHVLREDRDGVATLTLNRPDKLNALNLAIFEELKAHVRTLAGQTDTVGLVVLRGAGKCFSAGHDLKDIGAGEHPSEPNLQAKTIEAIANLPQPVITAVRSHCYTGGLELALSGDIIVAASDAKFADTHAKWGLTPVWGGSQRLPRRVGKSAAMEMMQTCRTVLADEALRLGLANVVFPDASFDADLRAYCDAMLKNSWFSLRANKRLLNDTDGLSLAAGLAHEIYRSSGRGPDAAERVAAFGKR
jgi:enoyl-CoA hydratase/carnithine racemase